MHPSYLTDEQVKRLLAPINPARVLGLSKGRTTLSYVAQHDIRAHLNRIFGFARWSTDVLETQFMWEEKVTLSNGGEGWVACYTATVKVTVFAPDGVELAHYTDSHASGNMPNPERAEAHALALTTAVSTAMKRAATCLGDQFGLSLYNKGQRSAFVLATLVPGYHDGTPAEGRPLDEAAVNALGDEDDQAPGDTDAPPMVAVSGGLTAEQAAAVGAFLATLAEVEAGHLTPGERILRVASLKAASNPAMLQVVDEHTGVTLGVLADRVAAGGREATS